MRNPILYFLLVPAFLAGCAPTPAEQAAHRAVGDYFVGDFQDSIGLLQPLAMDTNENYVLNNCRLGSASLADYRLADAEQAFLRAYEVLNSSGVNDPGRAAAAALISERAKIWKGEPYERAMANFYLGLIYYMRQDYANARGAFENALFKLHDYQKPPADQNDPGQTIDSDFALGCLMLAKSYQHLGEEDLARQNFARVAQISPFLQPLANYERNADSNILLVVDYGYGPLKVTSPDGAFVGFAPNPRQAGPIPVPGIVVDGRLVRLESIPCPTVDLCALAQQRRWQGIDTIRALKDIVGAGVMAYGAYDALTARNRGDLATGLALLAGGALLRATSMADIRQWEMLPRTLFVIPLHLDPGPHEITVQFPTQRQTWRGLVVPDHGEATYYFHLQRYNPGPFTWPPPGMTTNPQ